MRKKIVGYALYCLVLVIVGIVSWVTKDAGAVPYNLTDGTKQSGTITLNGAVQDSANTTYDFRGILVGSNAASSMRFGFIGATHLSLTGQGSMLALRVKTVTTDPGSTADFKTTTHDSAYASILNARIIYTEQGIASAGDLYGFTSAGQSSLVKSGASNQVLRSNGVDSMPVWDNNLGGTFNFTTSTHTSAYVTNFNARTVYTEQGVAGNGDIFGFIGSGQTSLIKSGASNQLLRSNGVGSQPIWDNTVGGTFNFTTSNHASLYSTNLNARFVYTEKGITENGDLFGFIGSGQSSLVKSGPLGYILKSSGIGTMPRWEENTATADWENPGAIGNTTPNTIKATSETSTYGYYADLHATTANFVNSTHTSLAANTSMTIAGRALTAWVPSQNILVNSEFVGDAHPSQANSGLARSNDAYNVDMWNAYSSAGTYTNFVGVGVDSNAGTYNYMGIGHDSSTANRHYAVVQIIETALTKPVQGQKVSLSFSAEYLTTNLSASGLSAGILCSTATADAPNAVYSAVPTLGTAWTLVASTNTGTLAATWSTYYLENISIPNNCNNIAVTFWNPGTTEAVNATWLVANPKLEAGSGSTPYKPDNPLISLQKTYRYVNALPSAIGTAGAATIVDFTIVIPQPMSCNSPSASTPLSTMFSVMGMNGYLLYNTTNPAVSLPWAVASGGNRGFNIRLSNFSGMTTGTVTVYTQSAGAVGASVNNKIMLTCEM